MDADSQMIRGANGNAKYNLAVGEPAVVEFAWIPPWNTILPNIHSYPSFQGSSALLEQLKLIFPKKHVVVTVGCKQALTAAIYALKKMKPEKNFLHHWQPLYWPSYLTMADFSGLLFTAGTDSSKAGHKTIDVVTWPNNPDGLRTRPDNRKHYDIWDAAYASPVYGFDGVRPRHLISTWSAAKLFGVPGLRIGWAVTEDEQVANLMAQYVEKTTSGVASPSQDYLEKILMHFRTSGVEDAREEMRKVHQRIQLNGDLFRKYLGKHIVEVHGVPSSYCHGGMFAFFQVQSRTEFEQALKTAGVKVVDGFVCGSNPDEAWYRMSMGHQNDFTEAALQALSKALEGPL